MGSTTLTFLLKCLFSGPWQKFKIPSDQTEAILVLSPWVHLQYPSAKIVGGDMFSDSTYICFQIVCNNDKLVWPPEGLT
jgi:hypothetical protein